LLRLVQLPVPPPGALAATGNVPLAAGCLAVAGRVHGLTPRLEIDLVPPAVTDTLGDTRLAEYVARDEPEFVGLSLYLWNIERSMHLAREVKRRSPRTRVLVGGPEVGPDNPFLLEQEGFDVAVTGEAEDRFGDVMRRLLDERPLEGLPGVAVRRGAELSSFGPTPSAPFPLAEYPSPYLTGSVPVEASRTTYVESVRGCRSHCTFCFYPRSSNVLRALDVESTGALLAHVKAQGAREVSFLDPTFNHRPDFTALLDTLAAVNSDRALSLFAEVRAEGLTPEHARKLAAAGFNRLELGLQSVNGETLRRVKRGGSAARVADAAAMLHDVGIELLVDLIVGLPGDTPADVARGVDFLLEHGLAAEAQVFGLSLLPGTAMRAEAQQDGVEFDPAPPYRVRRTSTFSQEEIARALEDAEARLGRRLDETPRPHLVSRSAAGQPPDVFDAGARCDQAGARHVSLWHRGNDLFARRAELWAALDSRLAVDPHATLDIVLHPTEPFPLDLIDSLRQRLGAAPQTYLTRSLAHRGEDAQRRIAVVLPREASFPQGYLDALREEVSVFREQSSRTALEHAERLGAELPGAWIADHAVSEESMGELERRADADAVAFAGRELERQWQARTL
jgi:radical SAM superfamily enzyme YgiQ (UPF0313 family)